MQPFPGMRVLLALAALLALLIPVRALAQDDPNEVPLGDVARNLRKNSPPAKPVIDDDNLTETMEKGESRQSFGSSLKYLMAGESKGFQVAAPDVTCSLAFTPNVKSLLSSSQYSQMDLPPAEVEKLEGPATIEGDALTVSVFNATNWHVSEVTVALTVVRKAGGRDPLSDGATSAVSPFQEVRPEKKPDTTVIYRMRAPAPPWERAVFSAPLNLELAPGEEWHWAIVQAKGYPPQGYVGAATAALGSGQAVVEPAATSGAPQGEPTGPVTQDHQ
jgi:hypothetical protein